MTPTPPPEKCSACEQAALICCDVDDSKFCVTCCPNKNDEDHLELESTPTPLDAASKRIDVLRFAFEEARRNERHRTNQETHYWLNQYKRLVHELLKAVEPPAADAACSNCGCDERDHRGILTCRCPEPPAADAAPLRTLREKVTEWRNVSVYVDHYTRQALRKCADELDALLSKETP